MKIFRMSSVDFCSTSSSEVGRYARRDERLLRYQRRRRLNRGVVAKWTEGDNCLLPQHFQLSENLLGEKFASIWSRTATIGLENFRATLKF